MVSWFFKQQQKFIGKRFGNLQIKEILDCEQGKSRKCVAVCDCGKTKTINLKHIKRGAIISCGCMQGSGSKRRGDLIAKKLIGKKFNRLTILEIRSRKNNTKIAICLCECGKETTTELSLVKGGHTKSCGCLQAETKLRHGFCGHRVYSIYKGMIRRCYSPNSSYYQIYGGRGITVCNRWRKGFKFFLEDMGLPPSTKHSIDRINNDGNYNKENCRWATIKEQARNKSKHVKITIEQKTKCLAEWCEIYKMKYPTVSARIKRGWNPEKALTTRPDNQFNWRLR